MVKIYGMDTCPDCAYVKEQIKGRPNFEYIDIGSHVGLLKEFIRLRDNSDVFLPAREKGQIGIPCFVLEDGTVSLNAEDAGLQNRPEDVTACTLEEHSKGTRNC
ncbi:MAG: glutaredoxin-related protein [Clostridiaceae bacterium]|nr:glutaredoxin-related protein [Clostridiaceae bacterium]